MNKKKVNISRYRKEKKNLFFAFISKFPNFIKKKLYIKFYLI